MASRQSFLKRETCLVTHSDRRYLTLNNVLRSRRRLVEAAVIIALAAPLASAVAGEPATGTAAQGAPSLNVPVVTARVRLSAVPTVLSALGMVDSLGKTTLTAPVTGKIEGPFQTKGQVAAGTVVARNVPPALHGQIAEARVQVQYAHTILRRTEQLVRQNLRTALDMALARRNFEQAKNQLADLRQEAGQQVMRAPFAGTVHYLVAPGTVVYRGTPVVTISGKAVPWIDVRVRPGVAGGVRVGEVATVAADSWHGNGRVVSVGQDARPWGLVRIRIGLPRSSPLIPGEWTRVLLMRRGSLEPVVPNAAVVMRGAKAMVYVIRHQHAEMVPVHILADLHRETWVAGSLRAGEKVAVGGVTRLVNRTPVISRALPSAG